MSGEHTVRGTEMSEKKPMPKCPYCGWKMQPHFDYPRMKYSDVQFYCNRCGAMSPLARGYQCSAESSENALKEAYEKAMRRYEEPNRVLTLDEVFVIASSGYNTPEQETVLWLERRVEEGGYATIPNIFAEDGKIVAEFSGIGFEVALITEGYGKHWRCWRRKPTKNERETAPWEDEGR